jgi:hypothetical protein
MVITDLDGTLLHDDKMVSDKNMHTLRDLEKKDVCRVIATGRNLFSVRKVIPPNFPIDYMIFSTGAGIMHWPSQTIEKTHHLRKDQIVEVASFLARNDFDFMIHHPIPENHYFLYYMTNGHNQDFLNRIELYNDFATKSEMGHYPLEAASQILAIEPKNNGHKRLDLIFGTFTGVTTIRTTSPLDKQSLWIEIFADNASNSQAGTILSEKMGIENQNIVAIGNDFNDLDMLDWAGTSFVVSNAAQELRARYRQVDSNNEEGFTQAVSKWFAAQVKMN